MTRAEIRTAYVAEAAKTEGYLTVIAAELLKHDEAQRESPANYGYVGDLGHINALLKEVVTFLVR